MGPLGFGFQPQMNPYQEGANRMAQAYIGGVNAQMAPMQQGQWKPGPRQRPFGGETTYEGKEDPQLNLQGGRDGAGPAYGDQGSFWDSLTKSLGSILGYGGGGAERQGGSSFIGSLFGGGGSGGNSPGQSYLNTGY